MVVKDIYRAFDICQSEKRHKLSLDAWSRMYDAGLPDLVQDIVMQPRFWTLPRPSVIGHLFDTQMQIAYFSYHSYQSFCPRVLSRADALWTAMWKNRQLIADWSTDRPAKHSLREHPVIQALVIYYVLHRHGEALVTLSSHMPHFSLYAWTVAEFQTEHFRSVYLCGDALRGPSYDPSIFVREAIINGVGVDACFTRLAEVLRGEDPWHWDSLGDLKESLHIFSGLLHGNTPETMTFVIGAGHHRIPSLAATIAKKHALAGGLRANPRFYNSTFSLIMQVLSRIPL
ncbi:hypothetical protein PENSPDRAFT_147939 [Peniophora sp. CONT]|nr:hypothetical protein PENSPDRAFT_147939 [Peniophora sp. CONT]